jgi:DNA polymerase/3'-5' exonuclease PolX
MTNAKCVIAGSILRKKKTVHDIDILLGTIEEKPRAFSSEIINAISPSGFIPLSKASGDYNGIPTQIWFCEENEWAPHLLEVTGPMNFNQFIRNKAKQQNYFLSNKGLFLRNPNDTPGKRIDNNTEGNIIWLVLGKRWIPPEMRY